VLFSACGRNDLTLKTISSRQNPLVARYRAAARGEAADLVLLDGIHLVAEAVNAGVVIRHAAVKAEAMNITEVGLLVDKITRANADVVAASASVMDALSPVRSSSTIVALADRPLPSEPALYTVDGNAAPMVVIAVDVQDPGNVGAIARVAEAGGATGMVAAGASASPFGWKALRGSMGSALRLPMLIQPAPDRAVEDARRRGCRIIATVPRDGSSLFDISFAGPIAILIGGEGPGLPQTLVDGADERVTIPMKAPVESLNAAVTAALLVYEARRQRAGH
jgi:RNA methyltransferase, TrmH family